MVSADKKHHAWMGLALAEARRALDTEDVPIGAVIIGPDGAVLGSGRNQREELGDPTAHAEVVAIREAADRLRTYAARNLPNTSRLKISLGELTVVSSADSTRWISGRSTSCARLSSLRISC